MDVALQKVNSFVTVSRIDKSIYTNDYDTVRNFILNQMKKEDEVFGRLCYGGRLGGSYADNIRVSKPDEFDVVLHLKLIERNLVQITPDKSMPAFIKIDLTNVMKKIKTEKQNENVYKRLSKLVDEKNLLIVEKVQSWFESIITKISQNNNFEFSENCVRYSLKYRKCGPAHTIWVQADWRKFSIDFVPGFVFDSKNWISPQRLPTIVPHYEAVWCAVPKPMNLITTNNKELKSFITSYADIERHLIHNKNNLKNCLKLLKKMRDKNGLTNLKSYFIKTVFLLETENRPYQFWNQSAATVLRELFKSLIAYIQSHNLPFFWDRKYNMLKNFSSHQINSLHGQLNSIYKTLTTDLSAESFYKIFLTNSEIDEMNQKCFVILENEKGQTNMVCNEPTNRVCNEQTNNENKNRCCIS